MGDNIIKKYKTCDLPYNVVMKFDEIWYRYLFDMKTFAVKTELLRSQPWHLSEHCYYDDNQLVLIAALVVRTILYVNLDLYVYRLQQSEQSVSVQGLLKHYKDYAKIMDTFILWYHVLRNDKSVSETKVHYFEKLIAGFMLTYYVVGTKFNKEQQIEYLKHIRAFDKHLAKESERLYIRLQIDARLYFFVVFFHFSPFAYSILSKMLIIMHRAFEI